MRCQTLILLAIAATGIARAIEDTKSFVAFSLKSAEVAPEKPEVARFGGITRPMGVIIDETGRDLIIIGEAVPGKKPVTLDDWVVILRGAMREGRVPLVSIDWTPDTPTTHQQSVRFEGGIANTAVGQEMLAADVALKKICLALLPVLPRPMEAYATSMGHRWQTTGNEQQILSRFWFRPSPDGQVDQIPGAALIEYLALSVTTQLDMASPSNGPLSPDPKDAIGERFAADFTSHIGEIADRAPEIGRLESIFRLSGLASAIATWHKEKPGSVPDLSFWLDRYQVRPVPTPQHYEWLTSSAFERPGSNVKFAANGGVDTKLLMSDLNDGILTAFKAVVLLSRPSSGSLTWNVPIGPLPDPKLVASLAHSSRLSSFRDSPWSVPGTSIRSGPIGGSLEPKAIEPPPNSGLPRCVPASVTSHQKIPSYSSAGDRDPAQAGRITASLIDRTFDHAVIRGDGAARSGFEQAFGARRCISAAGLTPLELSRLSFRYPVVDFRPASARSPAPVAIDPSAGRAPPPPPPNYSKNSPAKLPDPVIPRPERSYTPPLPRVGGVMLRGAAKAADENSNITSGDFNLIFDGKNGQIEVTSLRRFVTALWATYFTEEGPGISIDPIGDNWKKPHAVRYIGNVINSDIGRVMREADYLMKSWSVGSSSPGVAGWKTPEDFAKELGSFHLRGSRFWFVPENMVFHRSEDSLVFQSGDMVIKTEYLFDAEERQQIERERKEGKKHDRPTASPENQKWADTFTRRYAELAKKFPVLDELHEYARQVSLAKYLKENRIPLLWFMLADRELVITEDSPGTVEAFARKSKYSEQIEVVGGVNLAPSLSGGRFVVDAKLRGAIASARAEAGNPAVEESRNSKNGSQQPESVSVTPSRTVIVTDTATGGDFVTDLGLRNGKNPDLELARFRRADYPRVHTFGRDWHILIPYSVQPESPQRIQFRDMKVPEKMILRNLLSGREEVLHFDDKRYKIAGYIPDNPASNINIGLFFLTDGSYRLADKLGCEFQFDQRGRLTDMILAPNYRVSYKYGEKMVNWKKFDELPFRLDPEGAQTVSFEKAQMPRRLRLFDHASGEEELFAYDEGVGSRPEYKPENASGSGYRHITFLTDGSLLLKHRSGAEIVFDRAGKFRYQIVDILDSMRQNSHEVRFAYDIAGHEYRIVKAEVFSAEGKSKDYTIEYQYAEDGKLEGSSVVASGNGNPKAPQPGGKNSAMNTPSVTPHSVAELSR